MTGDRTAAALTGGIALLERAISYLLGSLRTVTQESLSRPTPCRAWDLDALLAHLDESIRTLHDAIDVGYVGLDCAPARLADPVADLRVRVSQLLGAWTVDGGRRPVVSVAGAPVTPGLVSSAGALELAVHGWDVARACGRDRPVPYALAAELLDLAPLLIAEADRPGHFAPPVEVPWAASPGDRLVAFLGRHP